MRFLAAIASVSVFALATLVVGNPVVDVSQTSVDVSEQVKPSMIPMEPPTEELKVKVERLDELLENDGELIAARIVDVEFHFDIDGEQVLLSGVPIELGLTSVKVNTAIIANRAVTLIPVDVLESKFDRGLATIEVGAQAEEILVAPQDLVQDPNSIPGLDVNTLPDMVEVRRIHINAHILELNGKKVVQTDMVAQVFDIFAGYVARGPQSSIPFSQALMGMTDPTLSDSRMRYLENRRLVEMWHRLPHNARVAIATFLGSLLVLVFFVALPIAVYVQLKERKAAYERVQMEEPLLESDEDEELKFSDEKLSLKEGRHA